MGMFDYVYVECDLPDRPGWAKRFQTKDLENQLEVFTISRDGLLMDSDGMQRGYSGKVRFYDLHDESPTEYTWIQYVAHFQRGRVVSVGLDQLRRETVPHRPWGPS